MSFIDTNVKIAVPLFVSAGTLDDDCNQIIGASIDVDFLPCKGIGDDIIVVFRQGIVIIT